MPYSYIMWRYIPIHMGGGDHVRHTIVYIDPWDGKSKSEINDVFSYQSPLLGIDVLQ